MVDAIEKAMHFKRLSWMDFSKFVAMAAVLLDHSYMMLYDASALQKATFFSVSLFILLAGYGVQLSYERKGISYKKQLKTMLHLFLCYCLANIIGMLFYKHSFDFSAFIDYLVHFNLQGPFYYFAFYFQLILVAPFFVKLCAKCSQQKLHWALHMSVVLLIAVCCKWLVHDTNILDIYGGGGKLLGGTYLLVYYIGMIFCQEKLLEKLFGNRKVAALLLCVGLWVLWNLFSWWSHYSIDALFAPVFGEGINPPGIIEICSAILMMCICYNFDAVIGYATNHLKQSFLKSCLNRIWGGILFLGRNTLDVFLYHLMAQTCLRSLLSLLGITEIWILRMVILPGMFILPAVMGAFVRKAMRAIQDPDTAS